MSGIGVSVVAGGKTVKPVRSFSLSLSLSLSLSQYGGKTVRPVRSSLGKLRLLHAASAACIDVWVFF